ncbi:Ig-like domain repeat protein [Runella sp. MFBS21]|uniref:Ig-like domain repeat protein n=1 Tax=Runella sp. MFBS21 TaxID=3034018 RepID=UPI0023F7D4D4|nr:Ig-like domain repeat protein [Runella sp. MFBS21]MDF7816101.1 Ig-like domain repeat protein [Runella sp. MFBS21]
MNFRRLTQSVLTLGILSLALVFNACKKEEEIGPAPTITAGNATQGLVGAVVKITATINAPEGLKTLTVLKNGQAFDSKSYTGQTTDSYSKDYTIETLPIGSSVVFTFQATDSQNQTSTVATQVVSVSDVPSRTPVDVRGVITGNVTWTKDKIYKLIGFVRVGADTTETFSSTAATGTLTIEPGTVIIGDRASKGTLIIQRGSKIIANGTADAPIVFTSERPIGQRESGDWGGLVICGRAVNNQSTGDKGIQLEGSYKGWHGGSNDADNSGSLKYVRVEYAGVPINPNQEVNSFTFGSVGSGTTMEYLQASYGLDDSFEWFGGTVNAKYLVAYRGLDDDFDMDFGYRGNLQFIVGMRGATLADQSGSNGFEVDNDGQGSAATPITAPVISNASLIGPKETNATSISTQFQNGMHLRRNTQIKVYNAVVTGYPNGVYIDGTNTLANAGSGSLILNRVVVAGVANWGSNGFGQGSSPAPIGFAVRDINTATPAVDLKVGEQKPSDWFAAQAGNKILTTYAGLGLSQSLFQAVTPTFTLSNGGTLATGGTIPSGSFFTAATFIGAFGSEDWTTKWSNFNPGTTDYSKVK